VVLNVTTTSVVAPAPFARHWESADRLPTHLSKVLAVRANLLVISIDTTHFFVSLLLSNHEGTEGNE
jgi:hypothetical protein